MDFVFNLFVIGIVMAALCAAFCVMGAIIAIVERIPALGKVFERIEGWMMR